MTALLPDLRRRLAAAGDARRAAGMQAYMKSAMPFHGVATPERRRIVQELWKVHAPEDAGRWRVQVAALWDGAERREERYAACDWMRLAGKADRRQGRSAFAFHDLAALPLFARMITEGAWWDLVDEIASHQIGALLARFPAPMAATLRGWAAGDDLWRRRTAIIAQLDRKADTDVPLLVDCITPSLEPSPFAREFFIAKGIGWALRQYARCDAAWVRRYLHDQRAWLPALSVREAAKHLRG